MYQGMYDMQVLGVGSMLLAARLVYTQLDRAPSMQQTDLSMNDLHSLPASSQHISRQGSQSQQLCTVRMRVRVPIICISIYHHMILTCSTIYSHVPVVVLQVSIVAVVHTGIPVLCNNSSERLCAEYIV